MSYRYEVFTYEPNMSANYQHQNPTTEKGKEAKVEGKCGYKCDLSLNEILEIAKLEGCNWVTRMKSTHMWYIKKIPDNKTKMEIKTRRCFYGETISCHIIKLK